MEKSSARMRIVKSRVNLYLWDLLTSTGYLFSYSWMYWITAEFLTIDSVKSLRLKMSAEPLNLHLRAVEMTLKTSHISLWNQLLLSAEHIQIFMLTLFPQMAGRNHDVPSKWICIVVCEVSSCTLNLFSVFILKYWKQCFGYLPELQQWWQHESCGYVALMRSIRTCITSLLGSTGLERRKYFFLQELLKWWKA